jgi:hypothetical protein
MIGGNAGYYWLSPENDPNWLNQLMVLGHVHALFSHLENYLRQGQLLPGPNHNACSRDLPAYEFPNSAGDTAARVMARQLNGSNDWLVTAFAASGVDRDATVTIPVLGTITVHARACGSVYTASLVNGSPVTQLMDTDGMNPSAGLN